MVFVRNYYFYVTHWELNGETLPTVKRQLLGSFLREIETVDVLAHHPEPGRVATEDKALNVRNETSSIRLLFLEDNVLILQLLFLFLSKLGSLLLGESRSCHIYHAI